MSGELRRRLDPWALANAACLAGLPLAAAARVAVEVGLPRSVLAALLLATAASAVALVALRRGRWLDGWRLPLLLIALWQVPAVHPRVGGDGVEYFALTRSLALDRDLDVSNDLAGLGISSPLRAPSGAPAVRPPVGIALFWAPFLLLAHTGVLVARLFGAAIPADGFSPPYQASVCVASFLFGCLALGVIDALLRRTFTRAVATLAVLAIWTATPLLFYMTAAASMAHAVSALTGAALLWLWLEARSGDDRRWWLLVGFAGGLCALVRVQDGMLLLLPLLDLLVVQRRAIARRLAWLAVGPTVAVLVQALVWVRLWGTQFLQVHAGGAAGWPGLSSSPAMLDVLVSPRHGLLTWTPLYAVCLIGWLIRTRREAATTVLILVGFAALVVMNAAIGDWWAGDSFGHRRFLCLTAFFALGLAEGLEAARRRPLVVPAAALLLLAAWNFQFMGIFNQERLGPKDAPVTLDRLAGEQNEDLLAATSRYLPAPIWRRGYDWLKGIWIDSTPRSLEGRVELGEDEVGGIVGLGWSAPRREAGVVYRSTRGDSADLDVPIRHPRDLRLTMRARRDPLESAAARVCLEVNHRALCCFSPPDDWASVRATIPGPYLASGLNRLVLRNTSARRRALAVDHLVFEEAASVSVGLDGDVPCTVEPR